MNEPPFERISQLERSVKRWRLISLLLVFLLTCAVAIGVIFTAIPSTQEPDFWLFLPWVRARAAERARLEAVREKQALEAQRRAADAAAKKEPGPP
jgi:hypothetical protein